VKYSAEQTMETVMNSTTAHADNNIHLIVDDRSCLFFCLFCHFFADLRLTVPGVETIKKEAAAAGW
jgi:hypothetical protein